MTKIDTAICSTPHNNLFSGEQNRLPADPSLPFSRNRTYMQEINQGKLIDPRSTGSE